MIDVPSSTEVLENMLQQLSPQAYGRLMQTWQQDQSDPKDVGHRVWIAGRTASAVSLLPTIGAGGQRHRLRIGLRRLQRGCSDAIGRLRRSRPSDRGRAVEAPVSRNHLTCLDRNARIALSR